MGEQKGERARREGPQGRPGGKKTTASKKSEHILLRFPHPPSPPSNRSPVTLSLFLPALSLGPQLYPPLARVPRPHHHRHHRHITHTPAPTAKGVRVRRARRDHRSAKPGRIMTKNEGRERERETHTLTTSMTTASADSAVGRWWR